jgi:exosortase
LYWDTFLWLVQSWQTNPFYSHGVLIPILSVILAWRAIAGKNMHNEIGLNCVGLIILFLGISMYLVGRLYQFYTLIAFSFVVVLLGTVVYALRLKDLIFPTLFLIFMIPIPNLDYFAAYLAFYSSSLATVIIHLFGIEAMNNGAAIILKHSSFTIGVPCSGLSSLISLTIPIILLLYFIECKPVLKGILGLLIIPVALMSNIIRIVIIIFIALEYNRDLALGIYHTVYGISILLFSFITYIFIIRFLGCTKIKL